MFFKHILIIPTVKYDKYPKFDHFTKDLIAILYSDIKIFAEIHVCRMNKLPLFLYFQIRAEEKAESRDICQMTFKAKKLDKKVICTQQEVRQQM